VRDCGIGITHGLLSWPGAAAATLALPVVLFAANCGSEDSTGLEGHGRVAELRISADVQSTTVASLAVRVSAADIEPALVFNLTLEAGIASGTLRVPPGGARTFTLSAFDETGVETHRGQKTLDVMPGANALVSIMLAPIAGQQPIEARLGTLAVSITNAPTSLAEGEAAQLVATVTGPEGPIAVEPGAVRWATTNSAILVVDPTTGIATARAWGEAKVVATYAGVADVAAIAVDPVVLAAGDVSECRPPTVEDDKTAAILDTLPGLVLALGDLAYPDGTLQQYTAPGCYDSSWGRHKARTRPVPGNHEYQSSPTAAGYFNYFGALAGESGKGWYAFNVGSWRVYALNSEISVLSTSEQVTWLKADLATTPATCVLAFFHRPRFNSGSKHGNSTRVDHFWKALYRADADVILSAHEHLYERFAPQDTLGVRDPARGIRQFTVGTGGADPLYAFAASMQPNHEFGLDANDDAYGVLWLALGANSYRWRFISTSGTIRDSGSGTCH
jgi:hypothetical protein